MDFYMEKQLDGTRSRVCEVPAARRLDKTALGMLGHARIEGLLHCVPVLVDGKRLLRYPVTDMQPLSTLLTNYLDGSEILRLMDELCEILSSLSDHLLDLRMLLPLESAFVSQVDGRLRMTYLPLEPDGETPVRPQQMLSHLLNQMMQSPWESAAGTEQLAAELAHEDFSLSRFWRSVQRLRIESQVLHTESERQETEQATEEELQVPAGRFGSLRLLLGKGKPCRAPQKAEVSERKRRGKRRKADESSVALGFAIPCETEDPEQKRPQPDRTRGKTIRLDSAVTGKPMLIRKRTGEQLPIVGKSFSIGSAPGLVDCCVDGSAAIAGRHAEVRMKDGRCYLVQLATKVSTKVDGAAVAPRVETPLHTGTTIVISDEEFLVQM